MLGAMLLMPVYDGIAKYLTVSYPVPQVVWGRYVVHLAALLPVALWLYGPRALWPREPGLQVLRGGLLLGDTVLFYFALSLLPMADTLALFFIFPLVVTVCAPFLLAERVGLRRWLAVVVGAVGALIVIRPGAGIFGWGAIFALGSGVLYALYLIATRRLAGNAPPMVTLTYTALVGVIVTALVQPFVWLSLTPDALLLMLAMGLIAATSHFLLIRSFDHALASQLAPFGYSQIVIAAIFGYVVFGDFPDAWSWLGIAVIVASGVFISLRERARALT